MEEFTIKFIKNSTEINTKSKLLQISSIIFKNYFMIYNLNHFEFIITSDYFTEHKSFRK